MANLMVNALAGTGKTSTAIWGLGMKVPKGVVCSEEQKDIVKAMRAMKWRNAAAQAYNTTIADELKRRVPAGVEAATSNAFGYRAWLKFLDISRCKVDGLKNRKLFRDIIGTSLPFAERVVLEGAVDQLVSLCKCYLMEPDTASLTWLCERFDIDDTAAIREFTRKVFEKGLEQRDFIDFNDQNFLPIYYDVPIPKYDLVLVDELQDLNKAKQEIAFRMAGKHLVGIGDKHQAIYGFSGADADAMGSVWERMKQEDEDAQELPLTITRRCPKAVVKCANKYVPELQAHADAPEGSVDSISERQWSDSLAKDPNGWMVLCRVNAPLTGLAFKLISQRRRCYIQGRDVGNGLKRELNSTNEQNLDKAMKKALDKIEARADKLRRSKFPDENKIDALMDRKMCMVILANASDSVADFCNQVDALFKDSGAPTDIQLSSVHKSKGLEHPRVAIYKPSVLPLMKKGKKQAGFQVQQERNLAYVAYTRSMDTLMFATEDKQKGISIDEFVDLALAEGV